MFAKAFTKAVALISSNKAVENTDEKMTVVSLRIGGINYADANNAAARRRAMHVIPEAQLVDMLAGMAISVGGTKDAVAKVITEAFFSGSDSAICLTDGAHCRITLARQVASKLGLI